MIASLIAAALALSACGSSGSSSTDESTTASAGEGAKPAESTTGSQAEAPADKSAETESAAAESSGALTPPGTELEPGESATVAWVPPGEFEPTKAQTGIELQATVESIEEGSAGDLKNIELEPSEQHAIPFYVHLSLEAPSDAKVPADEDPAYSFTAIDDRETEQPSVTFLGTFQPCEDVPAPKSLEAGVAYETCLTYLMNGGGSIEKVEWNSGPAKPNEVTPYFEAPIVWNAPAG